MTPAQKRKKRASQSNSLDREIAAKRAECLENVRATWDGCESADDPSVLENCVLRCSSAACYAKVYGDDALEDGEVDTQRGRTFRSCSRTELRESKQRDMEQVRIAAAGEREDNL